MSFLKQNKTDKKPVVKLWNDPSHTEPNMPHYALNEDLHRPNKKISIAEILAQKNKGGKVQNRSNNSSVDNQSSIVHNNDLNENLKYKLRILEQNQRAKHFLQRLRRKQEGSSRSILPTSIDGMFAKKRVVSGDDSLTEKEFTTTTESGSSPERGSVIRPATNYQQNQVVTTESQ